MGAQPDTFNNVFSAFWWAIATLTTVGYGDIYPITILGRTLGIVIALTSIGLVAIPTSTIASSFMESFRQKNKQLTCQYCQFNLEIKDPLDES